MQPRTGFSADGVRGREAEQPERDVVEGRAEDVRLGGRVAVPRARAQKGGRKKEQRATSFLSGGKGARREGAKGEETYMPQPPTSGSARLHR